MPYTPPKAEQTSAIASLEQTGRLPNDPYWNMIAARHDLNSARFNHYHPALAFLMDRNQGQEKGTLDCNAPLVSNKLLAQYEKNPKEFAASHLAWITKLAKADVYLLGHPVDCGCSLCTCPTTGTCPVPPVIPGTVPEPASIGLLSVGFGIALVATWKRMRKR